MGASSGQQFTLIDHRKEVTPGVENPSGTRVHTAARMRIGSQGVRPNPQTFNAEEQACALTQPAAQLSNHAPGGTLDVFPSPHDKVANFGEKTGAGAVVGQDRGFLRFLIDWTMFRTSGALDSHTIYHTVPDILSEVYTGCRVNTLNIGFQGGGQGASPMNVTADVLGQYADNLTTPLDNTWCGGAGANAQIPSFRDWFLVNAQFFIGDQDSGNRPFWTTAPRELNLVNISWSLANNLQPGTAAQGLPPNAGGDTFHCTSDNRLGLNSVDEGDVKITGQITLTVEDAVWFQRVLQQGGGTPPRGAIRFQARHPDSFVLSPTADVLTDPLLDTVDITTNENFTATDEVSLGDVMMVQNIRNGDAECLLAAAVDPGTNSISLDTNFTNHVLSEGANRNYPAADCRIYTKAFLGAFPQIKLTNWQRDSASNQKVRQTFDFEAEIKSGLGSAVIGPLAANSFGFLWMVR